MIESTIRRRFLCLIPDITMQHVAVSIIKTIIAIIPVIPMLTSANLDSLIRIQYKERIV